MRFLKLFVESMGAVLKGKKNSFIYLEKEDNLLLHLIICINTRKHILCHSDQIRFCLVVFFPLGPPVQYTLQDKNLGCVSLLKKREKRRNWI